MANSNQGHSSSSQLVSNTTDNTGKNHSSNQSKNAHNSVTPSSVSKYQNHANTGNSKLSGH